MMMMKAEKDPYADVYEVVETRFPVRPIKVILLKNTDDYGRRGQIVTVKDAVAARTELLLSGMAVYATEENLAKHADILIDEKNRYSSETVANWMPLLSRRVVPITMYLHSEWTLRPFHVKVGLRKLGVEIPVDAIEIPEKEIRGGADSLEKLHRKEFIATITINGKDKVPLRCLIHHWSRDQAENEKLKTVGWMHKFHEPVFEEDRERLRLMKRAEFGKKAANFKSCKNDLQKFVEWKQSRADVLQKM